MSKEFSRKLYRLFHYSEFLYLLCLKRSIVTSTRFAKHILSTTVYAPSRRYIMSDDHKAFLDAYKLALNDLREIQKEHPELVKIIDRFEHVCNYNVPHGKLTRGLTVLSTCRALSTEQLSEEAAQKARILGWCIEFLQAGFLVADDIMDESLTRRGKSCWYRVENVGMAAINDSFFLTSVIYLILKKHFRDDPCYVTLVELFQEVYRFSLMGQGLEMMTASVGKRPDFTCFTRDTYTTIVRWKTAYYSFYLPVALAMHLMGVSSQDQHSLAQSILLDIGHLFQVQDDYLDCYGDPSLTGKIGTDIEESKCSWLVVEALRRVSAEQRASLQRCYGSKSPDDVAEVKRIYSELDLVTVYKEFERQTYSRLVERINSEVTSLPKSIFQGLADKIYKREK